MESITFAVPFVAGQQRPRLTSRPFPHAVKTRADRAREAEVRAAFLDALPEGAELPLHPRGTQVTVAVTCTAPAPKTTRRGCVPYTVKPDLDNVCKLVLDALNGVAWADDAQVVSIFANKLPRQAQGAPARTEVRVMPCVWPSWQQEEDESESDTEEEQE